MLFATELTKSLNANSVKVYLAGVRSLHIEEGFQNPLADRPRLTRLVRGIKRLRGTATVQRLPITIDILRRLKPLDCESNYDNALFWAASCFGFFGFLRCGEFTAPSIVQFDSKLHLCLQDVAVDNLINPNFMLATIKVSKTDPYRKAKEFTLRLTATGTDICPIKAVVQYLHLRGGQPGALFMLKNGSPLTRPLYSGWLKSRANRAGLQGNYSGHSLRIGAATTAAQCGIPDHIIKTLGRWQSDAYPTIYSHTNYNLR